MYPFRTTASRRRCRRSGPLTRLRRDALLAGIGGHRGPLGDAGVPGMPLSDRAFQTADPCLPARAGVLGLAPGLRVRHGAGPLTRRLERPGRWSGQFVAGAVRAAVRLEVGHRVGCLVEAGEGRAGLQEALGVGQRLELLVGRRDVLPAVPAAHLALGVADLSVANRQGCGSTGTARARPWRRPTARAVGVDLRGEAPGDVVVAEPLAHDAGVPATRRYGGHRPGRCR